MQRLNNPAKRRPARVPIGQSHWATRPNAPVCLAQDDCDEKLVIYPD